MLVVIYLSTRSFRRPKTESYGPHMPTSVIAALPPGRILASAVGMCVCVPKMIDARPSSQWPIATFSLVASAWKSQTQTRTFFGICGSNRSAAAKGSSAGRLVHVNTAHEAKTTQTLTPLLAGGDAGGHVRPTE